MPLAKSSGNMYPWVTHMHTHLGGECPHHCSYCYVATSKWGRPEKYTGTPRLIQHELQADYGIGKTIFIEHMNDGFAQEIPQEFINAILGHCCKYPSNTYVFQSKNPKRILDNIALLPPKVMIGTTIETNRPLNSISKAPAPQLRYQAMCEIRQKLPNIQTFITIEPIMKFDLDKLIIMLIDIQPSFVNIGADSKHCNLPEPTKEEVQALVRLIQRKGLTIKIKHNLSRFLN